MDYDLRSGSGTELSPYTGPRKNEENPYCNYSGIYYGCNIWAKKSGTLNGVDNTLVSTDSEVNTYLNTIFYEALAVSTKKVILTHEFNITGNTRDELGNSILMNDPYEIMNGNRKETWVGKVGLPTIYDWFMANDKNNTECMPSTVGNGYYQNGDTEYECGAMNYLKTSDSWWTMSPIFMNHINMWYVHNTGSAYINSTDSDRGVRPTFFLSPSLELTGDGTKGKPYKIKS